MAPEYFEKVIQELAENKYGVHTLECVALLIEAYIAYDCDLKRGDTFIHRLTQWNQIECVKYMLDLNADPECRTSISQPDYPCKSLEIF